MSRFYVYHLIDPRDGGVFYVGKGQKSRGHDHVKRHGTHSEGSEHPKDTRIREIIGSGRDVRVEIVERFALEADALAFERDEIARFGLDKLTNILSGYESSKAGMVRDSAGDLTIKQERFAQRYVETSNASEAYRQAYNAGNMSPEAVRVEACRLLQNPNVTLMVNKLRNGHAERHAVTVDTITLELEEARLLALDSTQPSAAISASMGKAKLHGLIVDKGELSGKDGGPIETKDTTPMETARRIAFLLASAANQTAEDK